MAKFVQESFHFAKGKQCGFFGSWLSEIHHHANVWPYVVALSVYPLPLELGHPRTALLALSGEEVGIEYGQIASVSVENLVGFHVGMVNGDVVVGLKGYAV